MRRIRSRCCARATSGHAVAVPAIPLMKSRRRIASPRLRSTPTAADYIRDLRPVKWGSGGSLHGSNPELLMSAVGQKRTLFALSRDGLYRCRQIFESTGETGDVLVWGPTHRVGQR